MGLKLKASVKQFLFLVISGCWIVSFIGYSGVVSPDAPVDVDPWAAYGTALAAFLIGIRLLTILAVPQTLFNTYGLFRYHAFPQRVKLNSSPLLAPSVCIRVVTRGIYPKLVKDTVRKNMEVLARVGFENYLMQVVTDKSIQIEESIPRVRETVVPSTYRTKTGALNKSRALQYCLEDETNFLDDDDWIVHLDEETQLTDESVRGILNFMSEDKCQFGQGLITYASCPVKFKSASKFFQNRICTVADSFRVADDMGKLRCQFNVFQRPCFGLKGSYVVSKVGAERRVTFDNGPEGSKAEDCFFAMRALDMSYKFGFISGEMHEKSPFTFSDFFKQRKRWMQGIYMVVRSPTITWRSKFLLSVSLASWLTLPLTTLNLLLSPLFPMSLGLVADITMTYVGAMGLLMYGYGYVKQFPIQRYSWIRTLLVVPEIILSSLLSIVVENTAVCTMWFGDWYDFYIVEKEVEEDSGSSSSANDNIERRIDQIV